MENRDVKVLPRHPEAHGTESLWGYILRVSGVNGYRSPWSVLTRAGLEQHEVRGGAIRIERLAWVTGQRLSDLEAISYHLPKLIRSAVLLGHPVPRMALQLETARLCAHCVNESGFIEAHWDLSCMTACPLHMRRALTHCPHCSRQLRWYRRGLLRCECGNSLKQGGSESTSRQEAELLQIIRSKVLRVLPLTHDSLGLPASELNGLDLWSLLKVIRVLSSSMRTIDPQAHALSDPARLAADILCDWPNNYFTLLDLLRRRKPYQGGDVRKRYAPLYSGLLKAADQGGTDRFNFLREAFLEFVSNHDEQRPADLRLMRKFSFPVPRRYVTHTEFARIANVNPRTANKLLEINEVVDNGKITCPRHSGTVDLFQIEWTKRQPGQVLCARKAATYMGMPQETLRSLRRTGDYEIQALALGAPGYHELDIQRFEARICALAKGEGDQGGEKLELMRTVLSARTSAEFKAELIRAILRKDCEVFSGQENRLRALMIQKGDVENVLLEYRSRVSGGKLTASAVAECLGCRIEVVLGLIKIRAVQAKKSGPTWSIDAESVDAFSRGYAGIADLALSLSTSSRSVEQVCAKNRINLLRAPLHNGRSKLYARNEDKDRIAGLLSGRSRT